MSKQRESSWDPRTVDGRHLSAPNATPQSMAIEDKEAGWFLVRQTSGHFPDLSQELRADFDIATAAVLADPDNIRYVAVSLREDPSWALPILRERPDLYAQLRGAASRDPECILAGLCGELDPAFIELPAPLANDLTFMRRAIEVRSSVAQKMGSELASDRLVMKELIAAFPDVTAWLAGALRTDPEMLRFAREQLMTKLDSGALIRMDALPEPLLGDVELIAHLVRVNPNHFSASIPEHVRTDARVEVALRTALAQPSIRLEVFDPSIAPLDILRDPNVLPLVLRDCEYLELPSALQLDPRVAIVAVSSNPELYAELPEILRNDPEVALAFVQSGSVRQSRLRVFALGDDVPPPALEAVPPHLRVDPELAFRAVRHDPRNYGLLPPGLQGDRRIAEAAIRRSGEFLEHLPPQLRADPDLAVLAVSNWPAAMDFVDPSLHSDERIVEAALAAGPRAMRVLEPDRLGFDALVAWASATQRWAVVHARDPKWLEKPKLLLHLVQRGVLTAENLSKLSPELLQDRDLVLELAARDRRCWERLAEPLKSDPAVVSAAFATDPTRLRRLPDFFRMSSDVGRWVATERPDLVGDLPPAALSDRETMRQALARDATVVSWLGPELLDDGGFLAGCILENPLLARELPPARRERIFGEHPEAGSRVAEVEQQLRSLDIGFPERFHGNWPLLRDVLENRTSNPAFDPRPLAVFVYPKADWNGAFTLHGMNALKQRGYRVTYYETATVGGMARAIKDATAYKQASLIEIGGHGTQTQTSFGAPDPAREKIGALMWSLNLTDAQLLADGRLRDAVVPGGHVVLSSCSTGRGEGYDANIANLLADHFPTAHVWAPLVPTNNGAPNFNSDGSFKDPAYRDGPENTYHVRPRE